jgi:aspartyl-tRNA(Asn)/glutamyl-tRNA(Gln) amidotransferase subunit B
MNSFRAVKTALEFEENRQRKLILAGSRVIQETLLWNEEKGMTLSMRSKEEAHDYRYFPEPDLVPFILDAATIEEVKKTLPELPDKKLKRLLETYQLNEYDATILIQDQALANFFEQCTKHYADIKKICNWINGPVLQELNARKSTIAQLPITPENLAKLIKKQDEGAVSNLAAKDVLKFMLDSGKDADTVIKEKGLAQVSDDSALETIVDAVIAANPQVVSQVKEGKDSAIGFLIGQAMRQSQGKANPKKLGEIIKGRIQNG